jgi:hypothetical protein
MWYILHISIWTEKKSIVLKSQFKYNHTDTVWFALVVWICDLCHSSDATKQRNYPCLPGLHLDAAMLGSEASNPSMQLAGLALLLFLFFLRNIFLLEQISRIYKSAAGCLGANKTSASEWKLLCAILLFNSFVLLFTSTWWKLLCAIYSDEVWQPIQ